MKQLEGGFINKVYLENGIVIKVFGNDELVGIPSAERLKREKTALEIFGGMVAPRLLHSEGLILHQEYIEGETYEIKARRGEQVFEVAGKILARIHRHQINRDQTSQSYYEARFAKALAIAKPILDTEQLPVKFEVDWKLVRAFGACYIHGDFWLANIIGKEEAPKVIDWEFSGPGSPYEDFAIADLWILREFPGSETNFWKGYGRKPDPKTVNAFLVLRCIEFLATTTLDKYLLEEKDGFYHNKVATLHEINQR
ncbi:MAG: aminoglycoside phosphotransferase family protein [Candidatus Harrisonbacteria bacterium]|nr:aminoglycoside phosphotransferase family protein [Candidatus Harrisonbacteria bacterium]